ncbi:hypothetical protein DCAR_0935494 [Daucus carota subsp. sativus]|uniref:Uncharacterized protein n=1 Tax=Daucus carota subsp. sativus TaxID=79200 RepID=A0A175YH31_DAUCS|nr:hypothetical protein DCAR_0935494 [Daucus carota subsp. sativus]
MSPVSVLAYQFSILSRKSKEGLEFVGKNPARNILAESTQSVPEFSLAQKSKKGLEFVGKNPARNILAQSAGRVPEKSGQRNSTKFGQPPAPSKHCLTNQRKKGLELRRSQAKNISAQSAGPVPAKSGKHNSTQLGELIPARSERRYTKQKSNDGFTSSLVEAADQPKHNTHLFNQDSTHPIQDQALQIITTITAAYCSIASTHTKHTKCIFYSWK